MTDITTTPAGPSVAPRTLPVARPVAPRFGVLGAVLTVAGAALLLAAFFLPWWSATVNVELDGADPFRALGTAREGLQEDPDVILDFADAAVYSIDWYAEDLTPQAIIEPLYGAIRPFLLKVARHEVSRGRRRRPRLYGLDLTIRRFGWKTGAGTLAMVLAVVTLLARLLPIVARTLKRWAWIVEAPLFCAAAALVVCILAFLIAAPGRDPELRGFVAISQGVSCGVFIALGGAACLVAGLAPGGLAGAKRVHRLLAAAGRVCD